MMMTQLWKVEGNSVGNEQTAFRANLILHSVTEISLMMMMMSTMIMMIMITMMAVMMICAKMSTCL